jgi:hypothetical protein
MLVRFAAGRLRHGDRAATPANSIMEIVAAFSRKPRGVKLVVLGRYDPDNMPYHKQVVSALRFHSPLYVHGHQVGGTNPSLVEAMGAGSGVLAHGNRYNRWVAGPGARYFEGEQQCADR